MSSEPSDSAARTDPAMGLGRFRLLRLGRAASLLAVLALVALALHEVLGKGGERGRASL